MNKFYLYKRHIKLTNWPFFLHTALNLFVGSINKCLCFIPVNWFVHILTIHLF